MVCELHGHLGSSLAHRHQRHTGPLMERGARHALADLLQVPLVELLTNVVVHGADTSGPAASGGRIRAVEPNEIWELIVKADEALKYATAEKADRRREQAVERLREALREAEAIGNEQLAQQATTRLADLGESDTPPA